jgi:hypothetical protein
MGVLDTFMLLLAVVVVVGLAVVITAVTVQGRYGEAEQLRVDVLRAERAIDDLTIVSFEQMLDVTRQDRPRVEQ